LYVLINTFYQRSILLITRTATACETDVAYSQVGDRCRYGI